MSAGTKMAQTLLRDKARNMRSGGASLHEITVRLKIPKSTARYWCRDIVLSRSKLKRLYEKQKLGGLLAAEKMRQNRIRLTKKLLVEGLEEVGNTSKRDLMIGGIALYWAEGYRKGDGEFGFTNSDPKIIKFIMSWLEKVCGVEKDIIHLRVCINAAHEYRIKNVQKFWSKTLGLPLSSFDKPTLIRINNRKTYLNNKEYFGTLRIKVRRSTNLRRKIAGWIAGLARGY